MADDASITPAILEHPAVQAARLRAKCERAVDRLLAMLDALGPDPDEEPSLGFSEVQSLHYGNSLDQRHIANGAADDREDEHDGREPDVDDEHALGWSEHEGAGTPKHWSFPAEDGEPSLSASENPDQRQWVHPQSADLRHGDREDQCEDEGGACEDEGAVFDDEADDWGWEAPDGGTACPSATGRWPPRQEPLPVGTSGPGS